MSLYRLSALLLTADVDAFDSYGGALSYVRRLFSFSFSL